DDVQEEKLRLRVALRLLNDVPRQPILAPLLDGLTPGHREMPKHLVDQPLVVLQEVGLAQMVIPVAQPRLVCELVDEETARTEGAQALVVLLILRRKISLRRIAV